MDRVGIETGAVRHWAALCCLCVLLSFAWLETTHAHSAGDLARSSNSCAVCIAVHGNTPAVSAHALAVVFAAESLTVPFLAEHKGFTTDPLLFIRPPPAI